MKVFKGSMYFGSDEKAAEAYLNRWLSKLQSGKEHEQRAAKGLKKFIENGGAKYFVNKK